jgi:allantoate deiminase
MGADRPAGGARAVERCNRIGVAPYSDDPAGLYRGYLTPAYAAAQAKVAEWMREAGMAVRLDPAANLVGRYEGTGDGPPLIVGSHLDSIRDAGRYDGPLGIMLGIECVAALHAQARRLPFPIEVYAFGDEEGSRFPAAMLTSRAVAGALDPAALGVADADGIGLAEALATHWARLSGWPGGVPAAQPYAEARHGPALAYLEAHIEQGPALEAAGLPIGTVTGIAAQIRFGCRVEGVAGHAGTNSMDLRRDALAGAAAMVLAAERIAGEGPRDLVATVGRMDVFPGSANVVPGAVAFTLEVRAASGATRDSAAAAILAECEALAAARRLGFAHGTLQDLAASPCDPELVALMDDSVAAAGVAPMRLVSGAGHDAMILAGLCPTAMLFVRCRDGISHNPAEHVAVEDAEVAFVAMRGFLDRLAARSVSE